MKSKFICKCKILKAIVSIYGEAVKWYESNDQQKAWYTNDFQRVFIPVFSKLLRSQRKWQQTINVKRYSVCFMLFGDIFFENKI
jgi:hypothetical protein